MSAGQPDYEMVMPFILCRSAGGPYDDRAFVAGYRLGLLDQLLAVASTLQIGAHRATVPRGDVPQVDLIAMRHGWAAAVEPAAEPAVESPDDWVSVLLERVGNAV